MVQIEGDVFNFCRRRKILGYTVKQELNSQIFVSRAHENGGELTLQGSFSHGLLNKRFSHLVFKDSFHQFVGKHGSRIKQFLSLSPCVLKKVGRNFRGDHFLSVGSLKLNGLHGDKIDDPR
jgi:hypothetical protein